MKTITLNITEKAWTISKYQFREYWLSPEATVFASTRSKAKALFRVDDFEGMVFSKDGYKVDCDEWFEFAKRIKVIRDRDSDVFVKNGFELTRKDINRIFNQKKMMMDSDAY